MKVLARVREWFKGSSAGEKRLLARCAGDRAQMERLISFELQRRPSLSRAAAADSALDRWTRDR